MAYDGPSSSSEGRKKEPEYCVTIRAEGTSANEVHKKLERAVKRKGMRSGRKSKRSY